MKLFIDGKQADTDQTTAVSISLGIASITKIETGRTGYSKTIRVPMTATDCCSATRKRYTRPSSSTSSRIRHASKRTAARYSKAPR